METFVGIYITMALAIAADRITEEEMVGLPVKKMLIFFTFAPILGFTNYISFKRRDKLDVFVYDVIPAYIKSLRK